MADFKIMPLEEAPGLAPIVGRWIEEEWHRLPIHEYFEAVAAGKKHSTASLPKTFIAVRNGEAVGTVSLLLDDMDIRPDLNPWLGCLYVQDRFRGQGVGAKLVTRAESEAKLLGLTTLILFTVREEKFFARLGWIGFGREFYEGEVSVLMKKNL